VFLTTRFSFQCTARSNERIWPISQSPHTELFLELNLRCAQGFQFENPKPFLFDSTLLLARWNFALVGNRPWVQTAVWSRLGSPSLMWRVFVALESRTSLSILLRFGGNVIDQEGRTQRTLSKFRQRCFSTTRDARSNPGCQLFRMSRNVYKEEQYGGWEWVPTRCSWTCWY
jgi:hypothetical protein